MKTQDNKELHSLILECRAGDEEAFSTLLTQYTPMIRKVISEFADGAYDRDELFSEGCIALHSAVMRYDLGQEDVTFGLYARICIHNRLVDLFRKSKAQPQILPYEAEELADFESIESGLANRESIELIMKGASRLLSEYEYSVLLLHIQGYKTQDIAARLGKTAKSVDNAKARLFKRLRAEFSGLVGGA
ncbi:MAG: sigma-70 family RNA polymerase sigma factor [Clostridia bacterium]|nr:sigma-70 family RNA polymerase sigma factor [Clostridia bacterium]